MSDPKPRLVLITGPNGTGKTEFTNKVLAHEWLEDCEYINPDLIAQREFGDWNSPSAIAKAARLATDLRYRCLSESKSLALETVFSSDEKLEFVDTALAAGFFIRLFLSALTIPQSTRHESLIASWKEGTMFQSPKSLIDMKNRS